VGEHDDGGGDRDQIVIAAVIPFGDADAVVRCFGRERGRFGAFARGAFRSKKRFPGLMAPALATAIVAPRRSGDLVELVELDVDARVMAIAADLRAFGFCGYVIELVERFVPEGAPLPALFDDVSDVIAGLARHGARASILRALELRLLNELGVLPDVSAAQDAPGEPVVAYDAASGHLLARPSSTSVPFSEDARQAALFLLDSDADAAASLPVDDDVLREVSRIFSSWLRRQHVTLRSLEVLKQLPR